MAGILFFLLFFFLLISSFFGFFHCFLYMSPKHINICEICGEFHEPELSSEMSIYNLFILVYYILRNAQPKYEHEIRFLNQRVW